uniref:Uncharacterized protein n=1 Tax=Pararge aegeria TaxID=116150 RepID=S4PGR8_9NEOP
MWIRSFSFYLRKTCSQTLYPHIKRQDLFLIIWYVMSLFTNVDILINTCAHIFHTYIHTHIHTHIDTHINTHTHTTTHPPTLRLARHKRCASWLNCK